MKYSIETRKILTDAVGRRPDSDKWSIVERMESGSNCDIILTVEHEEYGVLAGSSVVDYFFSSGDQCINTFRSWNHIKQDQDLPDDFSWETAVIIAALNSGGIASSMYGDHGGIFLMSMWAYIHADADSALGL